MSWHAIGKVVDSILAGMSVVVLLWVIALILKVRRQLRGGRGRDGR